MKEIIQLEEAAMLGLSIYLFTQLHISGWWYPALILLPDISMLGYTISNKVGAITYNVFHHKGIAIGVYLLGIYLHDEKIQLAGLILFGHSSMDRILGYGLKYEKGFQFTHLGQIGRNKTVS
ncbi:MAG: DUF4260 domain-containing protein [Bacteroidetes bacterium]|nr:MAG: DUF4260 domain-containing protein [Bacteroidota bacterium]